MDSRGAVPAAPEAPAVPEVDADVPVPAVAPVDGEGEPGVVADELELGAVPVVLPVVLSAVPEVVLQGPLCEAPGLFGFVVAG